MRRWKNHIIALSAIVSIVIIMFWVSGALNTPAYAPNIGGDNRFGSERFVQIVSASWGQSCNRAIEQHNKNIANQKGFVSAERLESVLKPIAKDNALLFLSQQCDGKSVCAIEKVRTSSLGLEPLEVSCRKELDVTYRCYEYDKNRDVSIAQNKRLFIDCRPPTSKEAS